MWFFVLFLLLVSSSSSLILYNNQQTSNKLRNWYLEHRETRSCSYNPSKADLQTYVDSIYGSEKGLGYSGLGDTTIADKDECKAWGVANGYNYVGVGTWGPIGCFVQGSNVVWGTTDRTGDHCNTCTNEVATCSSLNICIKNVPAKPVRTISDATLPPGALYRPFYSEEASGSPDLSMSQAECEQYAGDNGYTYIFDQNSLVHNNGNCGWWAGGDECISNPGYMWGNCKRECSKQGSPPGCVQRGSEMWYNYFDSSRDCGYAGGTCIQKKSLYYKKSSGSPDLSLSKEECQVYAGNFGTTISTGDNGAQFPKGCYHWDNGAVTPSIYFGEGSESGNCGHTYNSDTMRCIEKDIPFVFNVPPMLEEVTSGAPLSSSDPKYVSESECEAYATAMDSNYATANYGADPAGCFRTANGNTRFNTYTGNTNLCGWSSKDCIQKKYSSWLSFPRNHRVPLQPIVCVNSTTSRWLLLELLILQFLRKKNVTNTLKELVN